MTLHLVQQVQQPPHALCCYQEGSVGRTPVEATKRLHDTGARGGVSVQNAVRVGNERPRGRRTRVHVFQRSECNRWAPLVVAVISNRNGVDQ